MKLFKHTMATLTVAIFAFSCGENEIETSCEATFPVNEKAVFWTDSISELSDAQYPDNPDISDQPSDLMPCGLQQRFFSTVR